MAGLIRHVRRNAYGIAALFVVLGGTAYAGTAMIHNGSIGPNKLRDNGVTTDKIRDGAVTTKKLSSDAVAPDASAIGGTPAANVATDVTYLPVHLKLGLGGSATVVKAGPAGNQAAIDAECHEDINGAGDDEVVLLAHVDQTGFNSGDQPHSGPGTGGTFLESTTDARRIGNLTTSVPGQPAAAQDIDQGFVMNADGSAWVAMDESTAYAVNIGDPGCLIVGRAMVVTG